MVMQYRYAVHFRSASNSLHQSLSNFDVGAHFVEINKLFHWSKTNQWIDDNNAIAFVLLIIRVRYWSPIYCIAHDINTHHLKVIKSDFFSTPIELFSGRFFCGVRREMKKKTHTKDTISDIIFMDIIFPCHQFQRLAFFGHSDKCSTANILYEIVQMISSTYSITSNLLYCTNIVQLVEKTRFAKLDTKTDWNKKNLIKPKQRP